MPLADLCILLDSMLPHFLSLLGISGPAALTSASRLLVQVATTLATCPDANASRLQRTLTGQATREEMSCKSISWQLLQCRAGLPTIFSSCTTPAMRPCLQFSCARGLFEIRSCSVRLHWAAKWVQGSQLQACCYAQPGLIASAS